MSAHSRRKGRDAEREVELLTLAHGVDCDRALGGRHQPYGDLNLPGVALEVRRRDRVLLVAWSREHEAKVPAHLVPAVAYRPDREPWRVSLPLGDFLDLLREREGPM